MRQQSTGSARHGIARVISKHGLCSRSEAERLVRAGLVTFQGRVVRDPQTPLTAADAQHVHVDGQPLVAAKRIYLALNKPRGLVTTASDEKGRRTVYECFGDAQLPWIAPVGRLDQASEGLLFFSNDPEWAAKVTGPESELDKTYHVQVRGPVAPEHLSSMQQGIEIDGNVWRVKSAKVLRAGDRTTWLCIVLDEGKNRQIRRILAALNFEVMRLVRVAIGPVSLDDLAKGAWRELDIEQVAALRASPS